MESLSPSDCSSIDESKLRAAAGYLPKDFVETDGGLIFAVVLPGNQESRVLASLRYVRNPQGLQKLPTNLAHETLRRSQPAWIFHSPTLDAVVHGIPMNAIRRHYRPSDALRRWLQHPAGPFRILAQTLCDTSPLVASIGVTGSYLIGAGHAASDIDLVVYGHDNFVAMQTVVAESIQRGRWQMLSDTQWRESYERRGCSISLDEYLWHEKRKLNKFSVAGIKVDLSCVEQPHLTAQSAGRKLERMTLQALVTDDRYAFSSPAVYEVEHPLVDRVLAFTPTYVGQVRTGETLQAAGWLEQESSGSRRLIVGSSREAPGEFIRVLR